MLGVADAKSIASQSPTEVLERLLVFYQYRHKEAEQQMGKAAQREASYYQGALQVFTFELERRGHQGRPEAVVTWETRSPTEATVEALRQEMRRMAAPPRELPAAS